MCWVIIEAISWVARKIGECLGCAEKKDDGQLKNDKQGGNCVFSSGKNYSHAEKGYSQDFAETRYKNGGGWG